MTSGTNSGPKRRAKRPEPSRVAPDRAGWAGGVSPPPDAAGRPGDSPGGAHEVEDIVSNAVRMGYSVMEEHLRHGRDAAERIGTGGYGVRDVSDDLGELSRRLLAAARDFGVVWFDFLEAGLRDPRLAAAAKRPRRGPGGARPRRRPGDDVALVCSFPGKVATVISAALNQPEQPALLTVAGLHAPDPKLPPIRSVTFLPGAAGVTAVVRIPPDQPPATYSGVICDAGSHVPLGMISVKVEQ